LRNKGAAAGDKKVRSELKRPEQILKARKEKQLKGRKQQRRKGKGRRK